ALARFAEQHEILGRIAAGAFRLELDGGEAVGERVAQVRLRVVRAAEVRAGEIAPADDELAALEAVAFLGVEAWGVRRAVRRDEQAAAGTEDAAQLVTPRELQLGREVREDGERVDEVEALVRECERRFEPVGLEAGERQIRAAPGDRFRADVAAA